MIFFKMADVDNNRMQNLFGYSITYRKPVISTPLYLPIQGRRDTQGRGLLRKIFLREEVGRSKIAYYEDM